MNGSNSHLKRRGLLGSAFGAGTVLLGASAKAASGLVVLNTAAIAVRQPTSAFLVAITRAADRLVAVGEDGLIIYSDDNGQTWLQAAVPVEANLTCVAFASPKLGWAAGHFGVILKTDDGGKTWKLQLNGDQVNAMALAAAQDPTLQNSNWPAAPLAMRRAEIFIQQGPSMPFLSLLPLGAEKALAFGAYRMVELTNDGGNSWTDWTLHIGDRTSINLYAVAKSGNRIYLVGEGGAVFCSTDDGVTFPALPSSPGSTLYGVLIAGNDGIIVFGVAGGAFRSTDNGNSWSTIDLGTQDTLTAGRVMSSGKIVIASEAGAVFVSRDDGATFAAASGVPLMGIFDLQEAADHTTIFVGNTGIARFTMRF